MNSWSRSSWVALAVAAVSVTTWPASAEEPPACPAADGLAAADCLATLAREHAAIAEFEPAARAAEALAQRYPQHPEAPELLVEAAWWRVGLGQRPDADADFDRHAKLYAADQPERAAEVFLSRGALLTDEEQRIAHLTEYLRRFGKVIAPDRRLVVEMRLGQIEWRRSCDKGILGDACLSIERLPIGWTCEYPNREARLREIKRRLDGKPEPPRPRARVYCSRDSGAVFTVYARDEKLARKAQQRFAAVVRATGSVTAPADQPVRVAELADAQELARLYVADREFEAFLARDRPDDLGLVVDGTAAGQRRRADGQRRLAAYLDATRRLVTTLEHQYADVAPAGSRWAIAAALRVGHIHEFVGNWLLRAELPPALDGRYTAQQAYCRDFAELAEPFLTAARAAAGRCLEHARDARVWNEYAELCANRLGSTGPRPSAPEIVGAPALIESRPETIGLQPFARWTDE